MMTPTEFFVATVMLPKELTIPLSLRVFSELDRDTIEFDYAQAMATIKKEDGAIFDMSDYQMDQPTNEETKAFMELIRKEIQIAPTIEKIGYQLFLEWLMETTSNNYYAVRSVAERLGLSEYKIRKAIGPPPKRCSAKDRERIVQAMIYLGSRKGTLDNIRKKCQFERIPTENLNEVYAEASAFLWS